MGVFTYNVLLQVELSRNIVFPVKMVFVATNTISVQKHDIVFCSLFHFQFVIYQTHMTMLSVNGVNLDVGGPIYCNMLWSKLSRHVSVSGML